MAAATADLISDLLASALKKDTADLEDYWPSIVARGVTFALQEVRGALLVRGFTLAQADAWDRIEEFTADLGLWYALTRGGCLEAFDDRYIQLIDRRAELKGDKAKDIAPVQVFIDGVQVSPASALGEQVGNGNAVGTGSGSLFNHPNVDTTDDLDW